MENKNRHINYDPDWNFEESDDPATYGMPFPDEPDDSVDEEACRRYDERMAQKGAILDYWSELKTLVDACGQTSHYWHMWHGVKEGVPKMKIVSENYKRNIGYYHDQYKEWKYKASTSLSRLKMKAAPLFKVCIDISDRDFLNMLTLDKGRRDAYKCYMRTYVRKCEPHPVTTLEKKYQKRLEKRAK